MIGSKIYSTGTSSTEWQCLAARYHVNTVFKLAWQVNFGHILKTTLQNRAIFIGSFVKKNIIFDWVGLATLDKVCQECATCETMESCTIKVQWRKTLQKLNLNTLSGGPRLSASQVNYVNRISPPPTKVSI